MAIEVVPQTSTDQLVIVHANVMRQIVKCVILGQANVNASLVGRQTFATDHVLSSLTESDVQLLVIVVIMLNVHLLMVHASVRPALGEKCAMKRARTVRMDRAAEINANA